MTLAVITVKRRLPWYTGFVAIEEVKMREMMQKALSALNQRKASQAAEARRRAHHAASQTASSEEWGMSPEDALRANTVARYK